MRRASVTRRRGIVRPHILLLAAAALTLSPALVAADVEFFERKVRPLFAEHCAECHGEKKSKGGLRVDSVAALRKGGESGALFVPGDLEASLLIKAVRYTDPNLQMPPKDKKLSSTQIADLEAWVKAGAPMPEAVAMTPEPWEVARTNWAFRKPELPKVPEVRDPKRVFTPVDNFIRAKVETREGAPSAVTKFADKRTLIRRATFDLTGLPPTPEEVQAFLADESTNAFAKVVDRLLASPRYGEKWARHWLDVVRYTDSFDSRGIGSDADVPEAWRYRDWVVDAFNRDLPYDQFILQQIAGDILATNAPGRFDTNALIATGVYVIGEWGTGDADKEKMLTDIVDDQIDVTGRGFLGLTLACARCHDHKFDPISARDYYSLAGIFFSSHILPSPGVKTAGSPVKRLPLAAPAELAAQERKSRRAAELDKEINALTGATVLAKAARGNFNLPALASLQADTDLPSVVANASDVEVKFLTISLPGKAVAIHPSPERSVAAVWLSSVDGEVEVSARIADVDDKCGNGAAWTLFHARKEIASGKFDNGQAGTLARTNLAVKAGDLLQLAVSPRGKDHACDTTQIEFEVRERGGKNAWRLPDDVVTDLPARANTGAWYFVSFAGAPPEHLQASLSETQRVRLAAARKELAGLRQELERKVPVAHGLQEGGTPSSAHAGFADARLHMRGRYDRLGEVVPRGFPRVLAGAGEEQPRFGTNASGRLELARWIASAENPLTARVMANRIWQHHFGEGIVRTPNNFGKLGTPPTHPELLDWLAHQFVASGWSIKAMHRLLMLSATYQQSSVASAADDPENLLFARMNRRRLTAEEIRDGLLQVSGQLDTTMRGPAINDLNTKRRTLYVMTIRSDRSNYRSLFDAPDAQTIAEKRVDSTVAPQALFLLNHPFALAQARALAERVMKREVADDTARIRWLYELLYTREPTPAEVKLGLRAVAAMDDDHLDRWTGYCQVLLCANEFIYVD